MVCRLFISVAITLRRGKLWLDTGLLQLSPLRLYSTVTVDPDGTKAISRDFEEQWLLNQ